MKAKKILLTTAALAGVGIAAYATKKTLWMAYTQGVVYVQLYKSDEHRLVGGVVYEDGRHLIFVYENGELTYEEEQ